MDFDPKWIPVFSCIPGWAQAIAKALSRLPLSLLDQPKNVPVPGDVQLLIKTLSVGPVNANHIKSWTDINPLLSKVRYYVQHGWLMTMIIFQWMILFLLREGRLSCHLLWGSRVIIPPQGRDILSNDLHETHPGIYTWKFVHSFLLIVFWLFLSKKALYISKATCICR